MFVEFLFILALVIGLVDLFIFLQIANGVGISFIIISQLISAGVGYYFLRKLDFTLFFFLDAEIKKGEKIITELWDEAWVLTGACLLILPGLVSDIVGALCLVKVIRRFLIEFLNNP